MILATFPGDGTDDLHTYTLTLDFMADEAELFMDGVSLGTDTTAAWLERPGMPMLIGKDGANFFEGEIAQVAVWPRKLTAIEIQDLIR